VLLAVCCTALAAGAGGVFSGVIPLPPGIPASVVVAGDPAGRTPIAHRSGGIPTANPNGSNGGTGRGGAAPSAGSSARPTATAKPTPSAAPSTTQATATPSATTSATPSASASTGGAGGDAQVASYQAQILALVNTQRVANKCAALTASKPLDTLAQNFSEEMAARNFFDHTDPDGKTPWDRAKALGITNLGGENIAMGQQTPADVMTAWMNSPGHRANILNCTYHSLGVGVHFATTGGPWWTQDFGF
jgi:uncharacterized protein YkwD